jgi:hypothetical protein
MQIGMIGLGRLDANTVQRLVGAHLFGGSRSGRTLHEDGGRRLAPTTEE